MAPVGDLFDKGPLQQTTGELAERWGQDGVSIFNHAEIFNVGASATVYTVSAGKTLYIKSITFNGPASNNLTLSDNGTFRLTLNGTGAQVTHYFDTPLYFDTSMQRSFTGNGWDWTFTGFEE